MPWMPHRRPGARPAGGHLGARDSTSRVVTLADVRSTTEQAREEAAFLFPKIGHELFHQGWTEVRPFGRRPRCGPSDIDALAQRRAASIRSVLREVEPRCRRTRLRARCRLAAASSMSSRRSPSGERRKTWVGCPGVVQCGQSARRSRPSPSVVGRWRAHKRRDGSGAARLPCLWRWAMTPFYGVSAQCARTSPCAGNHAKRSMRTSSTEDGAS